MTNLPGDFTPASWPAYQAAAAALREPALAALKASGISTADEEANLLGMFDLLASEQWAPAAHMEHLIQFTLRREGAPTASVTVLLAPTNPKHAVATILSDEARRGYDDGFVGSRRFGQKEGGSVRVQRMHGTFKPPVPLVSARDGVAEVVEIDLGAQGVVVSTFAVVDPAAPEDPKYVRTACEKSGGIAIPVQGGTLLIQIDCRDIKGKITKKLQEMALGRYARMGAKLIEWIKNHPE